MYKHFLIATDGSELAAKAVSDGIKLAKQLGARVTGVCVSAPWHTVAVGEVAIAFPRDDYAKSSAAFADTTLAAVKKAAEKAGVTCATLHVPEKIAYEGIIETAKAQGCDLIVIGSHGRRGLSGLLLGSQANKVLAHTDIAVLVVR